VSHFSLVVNAGGKSTRMDGRSKALLPVPPSGTPLIAYIIQRLIPLRPAQTVVVTNDFAVADAVYAAQFRDLLVVEDRWREAGPIGGIATGLTHVDDWAIVVACDMPFVNPRLFEEMCTIAEERCEDGSRCWDAVVPRIRGYPQMLHTLYHGEMLTVFERLIESGNLKLLNVLPQTAVRYYAESEIAELDPMLLSFTNVNTPSDWARVLPQFQSGN
jgi:molybdopterin-guanine dinucleotide biosynthesis protein A